MSKEQLMTAYLSGELGRRQLVRRLVAGGVTLAAALAYAAMTPVPAHAGKGPGSQACLHAGAKANFHAELCAGA
jgi:hypothetical protein